MPQNLAQDKNDFPSPNQISDNRSNLGNEVSAYPSRLLKRRFPKPKEKREAAKATPQFVVKLTAS
jgi:hypothetical protein